MLQLKVDDTIKASPALKEHIERNVADIEHFLPKASSVIVSVKKQTAKFYSVYFKAQIMGRWLFVKGQGDNLFTAMNEARRHLLKKINHMRDRRLRRRHDRSLRWNSA